MSCCQTVQGNRVLLMLPSTHFHILPCFSSFPVLPTPIYHPPPMWTMSHKITQSSPMIRCLHGGLGDCRFVGFLCFLSILCFLCLLWILGTLGLGVKKGSICRATSGIFNWRRFYKFFWWRTQSQYTNQTKIFGASSKFWFCIHGMPVCHSRPKIFYFGRTNSDWENTPKHPMSFEPSVPWCMSAFAAETAGAGFEALVIEFFAHEDGASTVTVSCCIVLPKRMNWCIYLCISVYIYL